MRYSTIGTVRAGAPLKVDRAHLATGAARMREERRERRLLPVTVRPGDWVRVISGEHRGLTGRVTIGPTRDATVYVRVRLSTSWRALLAVRVDDVVRVGLRQHRRGGPAPKR